MSRNMWHGDQHGPYAEAAAELAGYCAELEAYNQRLRDELAKAQEAARVLVHCFDSDSRPPSFAIAYGRALPVALPHVPEGA